MVEALEDGLVEVRNGDQEVLGSELGLLQRNLLDPVTGGLLGHGRLYVVVADRVGEYPVYPVAVDLQETQTTATVRR